MPNYDYVCKKCGHNFELFQKISEPVLKSCPKCGGEVKRLIGAGCGLIFKGSGFYITDYKRKEDKNRQSETAPKAPAEEQKGAQIKTPDAEKKHSHKR